MSSTNLYGTAIEFVIGTSEQRFYLTRNGSMIRTRMKQFKRGWWRTLDGAQAAADKLNAAMLEAVVG